MSRTLAVLVLLFILWSPTAAQQARDTRVVTSGSSTLTGTVVTADGDRPIGRAIVTLTGVVPAFSRVASTDAQGRFAFTDLPAGDVTVTAAKAAYVTTYYGARLPGRGPAVPIQIGEASSPSITIRLVRGAVIAGTILGPTGRPQSGVEVSVLRSRLVDGRRRLVGVPLGQIAVTDDRGRYRIWGLPAGEFLVQAEATGVKSAAKSIFDADTGHAVRYAPVYYPGTVIITESSTITIGASEERDGVDLTLRTVPTAELRGTILGVDSRPMAGATVFLTGSIEDVMIENMTTTSNAAGFFEFHGVPPGNDVIGARASADRMSGSAISPGVGNLWATLDVAVNGTDQSGLTLALHPGMTVTGQVTFEGSDSARPDPSNGFITLLPAINRMNGAPSIQTHVEADGKFVVSGLEPARYQVIAGIFSSSNGPWFLKSATWQGHDVLDGTLDIAPGQNLDGVALVFSNRATNFSGTLFDSTGRPVAGYVVVIFPADRRFWTAGSRRIGYRRLGLDGHFGFWNLPAGEYLLAAVTDVDNDDLSDPTWLDAVSKMAIPTTLADGEQKIQDIRLGKRTSEAK